MVPVLFIARFGRATKGGAAPNPFRGVCILVIRKPGIRRAAEVGDWIV
ncbi:MAG: hypothetical protein KKB20_03030 [Proteobacteria bacterium]|nr:hypothetical protein [Pseudomonadota bacterium]